MFENCLWIGADTAYETPEIIRRFTLGKTGKVTLYITGLGYFKAQLNGKPVTDAWFLPLVSDYEPRELTALQYPIIDTVKNRVYYHAFDVSGLLNEGENTLTIRLGNGWYRQNERCAEGNVSFGEELKTIFRLDIDGETALCSDGSEMQRDTVTRYSNLFCGEVIDYTAELAEEKPASVCKAPETELTESVGTPDRLIRTVRPELLGEKDGKAIYDAGENISGLVRMTTSAPKGTVVTLRFSEEIGDDLTLDFGSAGGFCTGKSGKPQIQQDTFITDGDDRVFCPEFVWHAFRYFEIEGAHDNVEVLVIHSDTPVTAEFTSGFEGMNYLYKTYLRTQLNNMHGSIPSDCPHRERLGYTGDGQVCAPAAMMLLESRAFYEKWIQDILDCQDPVTGHVQHTAPLMGGGGGPGGWGSAITLVPYAYYRQYGDRTMLERCFAPICRWIGYLESRCENGLVVREEKGGWCLGDWCTLEPIQIPEAYVNSCYFIKNLQIAEEIAALLGKAELLPRFAALREQTAQAIRDTYYDAETDSYAGGIQGADAYAVWCDLAGEEIAKRLADFYGKLGHFDTGFLCTDILLEVLFAYGHSDAAIRLLESEEPGSFLYMKRHGATTIWENWNGAESHDHPMFGAGVRHLFSGVLGVRMKEAGYAAIGFEPALLPRGKTAKGSILTSRGRITVELSCEAAPAAKLKVPVSVTVSVAENTPYCVTVEKI